MKENKGITLVALIITIIILLILAVVTITAVNEGSLFAHANNAAAVYTEKAEDENITISNYIVQSGKYDSNNENNENSENVISSGWWNNHGLTSSYVTYDKEYTADSSNYSYEDEQGASVEFFTDGGLIFIHGEDDSNISLEMFNMYSEFWGIFFNSDDNWFSFFDRRRQCVLYIVFY